ncbi:hypothetical protein GCM10009738_46220 [Kitasatospora viridis]|uniref:Uncharacterized protein n=1 Tax=Kitasatospora viridis TaxID=281105 RepID=A0A561UH25_9ACTN|nr:hypothetical protein FHX73_112474 [Kitasatospora viridis]
MPVQNPSTGNPFQPLRGPGTVETSPGSTGRKRKTRDPRGIPKRPSLHSCAEFTGEVNTMIDIQDIEVMAEALTCGSYNKG